MKKNDYLLLTATGAYSFLFYRQNAGINFLIFTVVLLAILLIRNKNLATEKKWLWSAILCLISAVCVFIHSSALSIIANVVSLLLVSAFSFSIKTSSLFAFLFSIYSVMSSMVFVIIDGVLRARPQSNELSSKKGYKLIATLIVIVVSILFFEMYRNSNPLFAENTKWINLDFISVSWIFFTLSGFLFVYGLFYHKNIPQVEVWENQLPTANHLFLNTEQDQKKPETEQYAGLLLFVLLNAMLVILNIGDIQTLYFKGGLPKNISHSDFVHSGVGLIILSIIIATALIMYLYRNDFTGLKNNKWLNVFVYLWIFQNLLMLSSTSARNGIYIHDFNFTYKRIGVYVWLVLAAVGLIIMFLKIIMKKSNWYLVLNNVSVWFSVLVLSSTVNWDKMITTYNLNNKPIDQVDFYYLFSLSDSNIPELLAITKSKNFVTINSKLKNYTGSFYRQNYYTETYIQLLNDKITHFLSDYRKDWKSFDLRDEMILKSLK